MPSLHIHPSCRNPRSFVRSFCMPTRYPCGLVAKSGLSPFCAGANHVANELKRSLRSVAFHALTVSASALRSSRSSVPSRSINAPIMSVSASSHRCMAPFLLHSVRKQTLARIIRMVYTFYISPARNSTALCQSVPLHFGGRLWAVVPFPASEYPLSPRHGQVFCGIIQPTVVS